jgi:hypothetical protein
MNIESLYNKTNIDNTKQQLTKISTLLTTPLQYSTFQNNGLNKKYSEVFNTTNNIFKFLPDTIQNLKNYVSDSLLLDHKRIKEVSSGTKSLVDGINPLLLASIGAALLLNETLEYIKKEVEKILDFLKDEYEKAKDFIEEEYGKVTDFLEEKGFTTPSVIEVNLSEAAKHPFVPKKGEIGYISRRYESGGNVGQITMDRDGYRSYGAYQFWSKRGNSLDGFLNSLRKSNLPQYNKLLSLTPNTPAFDAEWRHLSRTIPDEFFALQHYYNINANYKPMVNTLDKIGINVSNRGPAVQEAVISTVTQYGPSARIVFKEAFAGVDVSKLSDKEFIDRLYLYKFNTVGRWFRSSDYNTQKSVRLRFLDEMKDLGGADLTGYKRKVEKENLQTINISPSTKVINEQKTQTDITPSKKTPKSTNKVKVEEQKIQTDVTPSKKTLKPINNIKEEQKTQVSYKEPSKTEQKVQDTNETDSRFSFYNMGQDPQNIKLSSNSDPSSINSTQAKNAQASLNRNGWKYYG